MHINNALTMEVYGTQYSEGLKSRNVLFLSVWKQLKHIFLYISDWETHLSRQYKQSDEENEQGHGAHGLQIFKNTRSEGEQKEIENLKGQRWHKKKAKLLCVE